MFLIGAAGTGALEIVTRRVNPLVHIQFKLRDYESSPIYMAAGSLLVWALAQWYTILLPKLT